METWIWPSRVVPSGSLDGSTGCAVTGEGEPVGSKVDADDGEDVFPSKVDSVSGTLAVGDVVVGASVTPVEPGASVDSLGVTPACVVLEPPNTISSPVSAVVGSV